MGPEHEAAFQVLCRWSAALGYILMAHLDGYTSVGEAAKVQAVTHVRTARLLMACAVRSFAASVCFSC